MYRSSNFKEYLLGRVLQGHGLPKNLINAAIDLTRYSGNSGSSKSTFSSIPGVPRGLKRKAIPRLDSQTSTKLTSKRKRSERTPVYRNMPQGYYAKRFRKKRVGGMNRFQKRGYVIDTESGFELEAGECLYVGHGTAAQQLRNALAGAIARKLCWKLGIVVRGPTEKLWQNTTGSGNAGDIVIWWRGNPSATSIATTPQVIAYDATFQALRYQIDQMIGGVFVTGNRQAEMISIHFQPYTDTAGSVNSDFNVDLQTLMVEFEFKSKITLQNRSVGSSVTNNNLVTDVENNPIVGKVYMGYSNSLEPRVSFTANLSTTAFTAARTTGLINFDATAAGVPAGTEVVLRNPPSKGFFKNVLKMGNTRLNPGQIRCGYLSHHFKGSVKRFILSIIGCYEQPSGEPVGKIWFGKSEMYAFELMVDSRVTEEPDVKVGGSIKQQYSCRVWNYQVGIMNDYFDLN